MYKDLLGHTHSYNMIDYKSLETKATALKRDT